MTETITGKININLNVLGPFKMFHKLPQNVFLLSSAVSTSDPEPLYSHYTSFCSLPPLFTGMKNVVILTYLIHLSLHWKTYEHTFHIGPYHVTTVSVPGAGVLETGVSAASTGPGRHDGVN